jgi:hypothetical protein
MHARAQRRVHLGTLTHHQEFGMQLCCVLQYKSQQKLHSTSNSLAYILEDLDPDFELAANSHTSRSSLLQGYPYGASIIHMTRYCQLSCPSICCMIQTHNNYIHEGRDVTSFPIGDLRKGHKEILTINCTVSPTIAEIL